MKQSDQSHHIKDRHSTCGPKNRREGKRFVDYWEEHIGHGQSPPHLQFLLVLVDFPSGCYDASSMGLVYVILSLWSRFL